MEKILTRSDHEDPGFGVAVVSVLGFVVLNAQAQGHATDRRNSDLTAA